MNINKLKLLSTFFILILVAACQQNAEQPLEEAAKPEEVTAAVKPNTPTPVKEVKPVKKPLPYRGTINYYDLEGGFFGITTDKGLKFLPMGLSPEFMQDGAIVEFSGMVEKDVMTIQQWGTPFKVNQINMIKPGKPVKRGGQHELM